MRWARFHPPYFDQVGPIFSLDSVGALYVVNADIYRQGARHEADKWSLRFIEDDVQWSNDIYAINQRGPANCFTEHFSVCQWAKNHGFPVRAYEDLVARHAINH